MIKFLNKPSPNFYGLDEPAYIVILHATLGSYDSALGWLRNPRSNVSSHLLFDRKDRVAQLVPFNKGAWHSGGISNPSARAKAVCRKDWRGRIKNPNKYSFGFEVACGWDIDKDGVIESWEKAYTPYQIKNIAKAILKLERERGIKLSDSHILTHRDIASYKPDLEFMRTMVLTEVRKLREKLVSDSVVEPIEVVDREKIKKEIIDLVGKL